MPELETATNNSEETSKPLLKGRCKQVLSGDTIVIREEPKGGPPPEKTIGLSNVVAPKLARVTTSQGKKTIEEEEEGYAWESREFLRKLVTGKEIYYRSEYEVPDSGRIYGYVFVKNQSGELENVANMLLSNGLAMLRTNRPIRAIKSREEEVFEELQAQAKEAGIGVHSPDKDEHKRNMQYGAENTFAEKVKGQELDAVIEHVRDGSTMWAMILPCAATNDKFIEVMIALTGIKCPRSGRDSPDEPYFAEARFFTESRLLQRDIKLLFEGRQRSAFEDRQSISTAPMILLATVKHPAGNISELLLKEGFAKCVDWTVGQLTDGTELYKAAEKSAKAKKLRIWQNYVNSASSIKDKEFSGKVTEIFLADAISVRNAAGQDVKIFFSSLRQPRAENNENDPKLGQGNQQQKKPLYNIPCMFEAREFLRKKLIGNKVQVSIDYIKPASGTFPEKKCATVMAGNINIAEALISRGLATCIVHAENDDQRSPHYSNLIAASDRAKKNSKGVFSKKATAGQKVNDLTLRESINAARQFLPFLQKKNDRMRAIVEFVASGSRFRLYIPTETVLFTFLLGGISCPRTEVPTAKIEGEPYGNEAQVFSKNLCLQRDVEVVVESMDKGGNFIGWLFVDNVNLSVALVEQGLSTVHPAVQQNSTYAAQLIEAAARAKSQKLNMWSNYVEEKIEVITESDNTERKVAYKKVIVTEIVKGATFWAQSLENISKFETMQQQMRNGLINNPPLLGTYRPSRGEIIAALFVDKLWYRAKVEKIDKDSRYHVLYIDYGNRLVVSATEVAQLATEFKSMEAQAREYTLAFLKLHDDYLNELTEAFWNEAVNKEFSLNVEYRSDGKEYVQLANPEEKVDLNSIFLSDGLVLLEKRPKYHQHPLFTEYVAAQETAKSKRMNIWRYGDITEDDAPEFGRV